MVVDPTLHKTLRWDRNPPKISQLRLLKVLIVVGGVDAEQALAGSELLDLNSAGSTWSPSTPLPAPMWGARGALLGGRFLLVGGYARSRSYQDSVLAWDSVSQVFLSLHFQVTLENGYEVSFAGVGTGGKSA